MTVVHCISAGRFLELLHEAQGLPLSGQWYFRGQAQHTSWGLVPSLFRLRHYDEETQVTSFEENILKCLREHLRERSDVPDRFLNHDDTLLALAQRYGCPTRLLDWTRSPLVAAYFAASSAIRNSTPDKPLVVYAIPEKALGATHVHDSSIIDPMQGANANLAAQRGVLIKHDWRCRDMWKADFDNAVACSAPLSEQAALMAPVSDPTYASHFLRFELDARLSGQLLAELATQRVDGIELFPGMLGYAKAAFDDACVRQRKTREEASAVLSRQGLKPRLYKPPMQAIPSTSVRSRRGG